MGPLNYVGIISIFVLHAIAQPLLCPPRRKLAKGILSWCIFLLLCVIVMLIAITLFPLKVALLIGLFGTATLGLLTTLHLSSCGVPKTLFLFLSYADSYMVILIVAHLLSYFFFNDSELVASGIRTVLHICLIIFFAVVMRRKFEIAAHNITKGWWPLNMVILLLFINMSLLLIRLYASAHAEAEILPFFLLLAITIAVYWLFFHTIGYMQNLAQTQRLELQSNFLMRQVRDMQESIENSRRVAHDARHHNLQIAEYVRNGELNELMSYLHQYEDASQAHIPVKICENLAANNILNVYVRKAEQNGIDVSFDVTVDQDINIKDTDIVAILANIMENAIFGCVRSKQPNRFIELFIGYKVNKLVIQCRNTASMNIAFENGRPKGKHDNGIGVPSILHSASLYGGETDFQSEGGTFVCRVLLKIQSEADVQLQ